MLQTPWLKSTRPNSQHGAAHFKDEYRKSHDAERAKDPKLGSEIPRVKDTTLGKLVFFRQQLEALFLQHLATNPDAAKIVRDPSWESLEETYPRPEKLPRVFIAVAEG